MATNLSDYVEGMLSIHGDGKYGFCPEKWSPNMDFVQESG